MQMVRVFELQKAWKEKGSPPCAHPDWEQEHYLGSGTGDYHCTTCGAYVDPDELRKRKSS